MTGEFVHRLNDQLAAWVSGRSATPATAAPAPVVSGFHVVSDEAYDELMAFIADDQMRFHEPQGEARKSAESAQKPRLELVPWAAISDIAEVLTFGAAKYDANNWCRGARWGRYFAALLRHLFAWWRGEEFDPETGLSHLAHAGCCLMFLMEYQRNGWGTDDRFKGVDGEQFQKRDGEKE